MSKWIEIKPGCEMPEDGTECWVELTTDPKLRSNAVTDALAGQIMRAWYCFLRGRESWSCEWRTPHRIYSTHDVSVYRTVEMPKREEEERRDLAKVMEAADRVAMHSPYSSQDLFEVMHGWHLNEFQIRLACHIAAATGQTIYAAGRIVAEAIKSVNLSPNTNP